ncbi:MAG: prolipoprotein diacylglyceryl transferase [Lacipirellulaceae bacterium]
MRSELFRIPVELFGLPVLGFGLLLALWLVGWGVVLGLRYARRGADGDFWGFLTPAAIGAGVIALAPRFCPEGVPIRGYGVMLLAAILTGLAMAVHRARRIGVPPDTVFSLAFWMFLFGIAGARLFFVVEYWETTFGRMPLASALAAALQFTEGGLVVYGSLIGAALVFLWFAWKHELPTLALADALAPTLAAGLALGRLGCLLNGCCYGGACDLPWAVTFPASSPPFADQLASGALHGLEIDERNGKPMIATGATGEGARVRLDSLNGTRVATIDDVSRALFAAYERGAGVVALGSGGERVEVPPATRTRSLPVHPAQVYAAITGGLLAWLAWAHTPLRRRDGEVVLLMLTVYPVLRFLEEVIRTDEGSFFGTGLSISQNVSVGLLAAALVGWWLLARTTPRTAALAPA